MWRKRKPVSVFPGRFKRKLIKKEPPMNHECIACKVKLQFVPGVGFRCRNPKCDAKFSEMQFDKNGKITNYGIKLHKETEDGETTEKIH